MRTIVKNNNYEVYEEYDNDGNKYYLCIPNNNDIMEYRIFCGLSKDNMTSEKIISSVSNTYDKITKKKKNIIYVNIIIENDNLMEASMDNDKRLYNFLYNRIYQTTSHAYNTIIKLKLAAISNTITMVKDDEDDTKFINWLESTMPMWINSISLFDNDYEDTIEIPFSDTNDSGGGNLLAGGGIEGELVQNKEFTKKKVPPKNNHGFGNIILVTIILLLALIVGVTVAYILIK